MVDVIVAGHICVDLIPTLPNLPDGFSYDPGTLLEVGPATVSTGGCVPNAGGALHRLGSRVRLVGRVGDDQFGGIARRSLASKGRTAAYGSSPKGRHRGPEEGWPSVDRFRRGLRSP